MTTRRSTFEHIGFHVHHARWRLVLFIFLMTLNGIADTLGIALFLPLLELTISTTSEISELSAIVLRQLEWIGASPTLGGLLLIMCLMFILKGVLVFSAQIFMMIMRTDLEESLRGRLAKHIRDASYDYVMSRKVSEFSTLFAIEIQGVLQNFQYLANLLGASATVAIYILAAFFVDPLIGGVSVAFGIVLGFLIKFMTERIQNFSRSVTKANLEVESHFLDFLQSYKYLKATETSEPIIRLILNELKNRRNLFIRMSALRTLLDSSVEPMAIIVVAVFTFVMVEVQGHELPPILLSLAYLYRSVSRVGVIHQSRQNFGTSVGSVEAIQSSFHELEVEKDVGIGRVADKIRNGVSLHNVHLRLGGEKILENVSIKISRGEFVGLVGETGSGKSSLADIIGGLRKPDAGIYYRDGVPLTELNLETVRQRNGFVTQEPVLFHGSIAVNVSLWEEDPSSHGDASEKLMKSLEMAKALSFIEEMPEGVATVVGSRGRRLSGGQVQRLAIAREFYRNTDLLVFDEATSALDAETDHNVIRALRGFAREHAALIISHRISNLQFCNKIYVLNKGRLMESGTWNELSENPDSWLSKALSLQKIEAVAKQGVTDEDDSGGQLKT